MKAVRFPRLLCCAVAFAIFVLEPARSDAGTPHEGHLFSAKFYSDGLSPFSASAGDERGHALLPDSVALTLEGFRKTGRFCSLRYGASLWNYAARPGEARPEREWAFEVSPACELGSFRLAPVVKLVRIENPEGDFGRRNHWSLGLGVDHGAWQGSVSGSFGGRSSAGDGFGADPLFRASLGRRFLQGPFVSLSGGLNHEQGAELSVVTLNLEWVLDGRF